MVWHLPAQDDSRNRAAHPVGRLQDAVDVAGNGAQIASLDRAVDVDDRLHVVVRDNAGARAAARSARCRPDIAASSSAGDVIGMLTRSDIEYRCGTAASARRSGRRRRSSCSARNSASPGRCPTASPADCWRRRAESARPRWPGVRSTSTLSLRIVEYLLDAQDQRCRERCGYA